MLKRLSLYTLLLLLLPIGLFYGQEPWQESANYDAFAHGLFYFTQTASKPYALITCAIFALFYFYALKNKKKALLVIGIMAGMVIVSQGIKSVLKPLVQEERPFMSALLSQTDMPSANFHQLAKKERAEVVKAYYKQNARQTPKWLVKHRAKETSYSFPSGHSLFVAVWLMLAVGFAQLAPKNRPLQKILPVILVWAWLVLLSRVQLGMHYPQDLIASIGLAWLLNVPLFMWLEKKKYFANWAEK